MSDAAGVPVAGVDGCPDGWVVAVLDPGGLRWHVKDSAHRVLEVTAGCGAVAVDIPMGLPDTGRRACDLQAKVRLGAARSSVFPAPLRPMLTAGTYGEACAIGRRAEGLAISRQTFGLLPKILQWDRVLTPGLQDRVVEAHPEVSFRAMGVEPSGKKTGRGAALRLAALARCGLPALTDRLAVLDGLPAGPGLDDALDALACAWTAARWLRGEAEVLPSAGPEATPAPGRDARGLAMRIVC